MVNIDLLSQLHSLAKIDNLGNAETAAEMILSEALAKRPETADWVKRKAAAVKQANAEWAKAWNLNELP